MDKHTFKVGDRVVALGAKGVLIRPHDEEYSGNWLVLRDDKHAGSYAPYYTYNSSVLQHDTNFQVGDWVRYEGVTESCIPSKEGQVGQITEISNRWVRVRGIHANMPLDVTPTSHEENLVKIQPPQEEEKMNEKKEQIDIVHKETGEVVRDVREVMHPCYAWVKEDKDRRITFSIEHWKRYEEWVKIEVNKKDWDKLSRLAFQYNSDGNHTIGGVRWRYPQ